MPESISKTLRRLALAAGLALPAAASAGSAQIPEATPAIQAAPAMLQAQKRVNVDFPTWMIDSLDREASKLGVTRQSVIKVWLAERLEATSSSLSVRRTRAGAVQR